MAGSPTKSRAEIPTIDCNLITIEVDGREFGFETSNKIEVEPQIEEQEAVQLIVKGKLIAQKPKTSTLTGNQITLTDNVFNPELVQVLQGGNIVYSDPETRKIVSKYTPPAAGSGEKGKVFKLNAYSAQYNAAGIVVKYEKITYPNCQGQPVAFGSEDGVFRAPEYTIMSSPDTGEAPYEISYVDELPTLAEPPATAAPSAMSEMSFLKNEESGLSTLK